MICLLCCCAAALHAQRSPISGRVLYTDGTPAADATIYLLQAADSAVAKLGISNADGRFELLPPEAGDYFVKVTALGFREVLSGSIPYQGLPYRLADLVLQEQAIKELQAVTVSGKKRFLERRTDRVIVNVADNPVTANAGSVLELLQKLPGVSVDHEGRIALQGRQGVTIMLDGKRNYLSAGDLANLLRSLPGDNVSRIELMANPSASFDAAGSAGIINIRTKRDPANGWNAILRSGAGIGHYPKWNGGGSFTCNTARLRTFISYDYTDRKGIRESDLQREVAQKEGPLFIRGISKGTQQKKNHVLQAGLDYKIDAGNTIGITINRLHNKTINRDIIHTDFRQAPSLPYDSAIYNTNTEHRKFSHWGGGLVYNLSSDSGRRELNANLDYSRYSTAGMASITNNYLDSRDHPLRSPAFYQTPLSSRLSIASAQLDYAQQLGRKIKLETGVKVSNVDADNDFRFNILQEDSWKPDAGRTNRFLYNEQVYAAYISFHKDWGKTKVQAGLRLEDTHMKGTSPNSGTINRNNYLQLFPSAFLTREINSRNEIGFSYSRRIDRPDYMDLNPFRFYNDEYSYQEGNPYLRPELTHNIEVSHTYNSFLSTTASYGHTSHVITQVTEQDDSTKIMVITTRNLSSRHTYALNISAPVDITPWLSSYFSLQGFYQEYSSSDYLNSTLNNGRFSVLFYMSHDITLSKSWDIQCAFDYQSPIASGIFNFKTIYGLDLGVKKQFLDKKLTARLSVYDLFYTHNARLSAHYSNVNMRLDNKGETRYIRLSLTYNFRRTARQQSKLRRDGHRGENSRVKDRDLH